MPPASLFIFAAALFVAAGSPGPSIAALVARVLARGPRDVLPFVLAMLVGEAVWLSFAVFGLVALAQSFHLAFVAVKWAGVAYLLVLARKMWVAPAEVVEGGLPGADGPWRMFATGIAVTLGNPKIMMFYLAVLPTIVDLASVTWIGWAELVATMLAVLATIQLGWTLAASQARRLLRSPRAVRIANRVGAGLVVGAAGTIAARS